MIGFHEKVCFSVYLAHQDIMLPGQVQPDLMNCFIQKQDTVTIPPLSDPQLQNAAFSVIEAAKSQLSELKLADLFSKQLQGEKASQFISEFLYHWAGVDSKPPESMVEQSKKSLHSIIHGFLSTHDTAPSELGGLISPLLPYLTSVSEVEEFSAMLNRTVYAGTTMPEEAASLVDLATLGTVMSEVSIDTEESPESDVAARQAAKRREIQSAFQTVLDSLDDENEEEQDIDTGLDFVVTELPGEITGEPEIFQKE